MFKGSYAAGRMCHLLDLLLISFSFSFSSFFSLLLLVVLAKNYKDLM